MKEEFINFKSENEDILFAVSLAGISYCDGSYIIKREKADCMVAEYILKGQGTVVLNGKEYLAKEGDIYLLPSGCAHLYYSDKTYPWEKLWFNVRGTLPNLLLQEYNPRNLVVFSDAGGREYFEKIHEIGRGSEYSGEEKNRKIALILHELLQHLYGKFYSREQHWTKETKLMKEYLDDHITSNVSLKELGDLVYLSESQVVRKFKREIGKTPHEYCLDIKLEQAEKFLANTCLRVKEISNYLGFCDEHYFSYIFKKKTGKTPLEYRKSSNR